MLHLLPHWTWPGREGETTPVHCYTNFFAVELFLNGRSLGRQYRRDNHILNTFRLVWPDVRYQPGELRAVAYNEKGEQTAETTAGEPAAIALQADSPTVAVDDDALGFVTVRIVDCHGTLCPTADHDIHFTVEGPGRLAAVCNGDASDLGSFQASHCRAFSGICVVTIAATARPGVIRLRATAPGLESAHLALSRTDSNTAS